MTLVSDSVALEVGGTVQDSIFGKYRDYDGTNEGTIIRYDPEWINVQGDAIEATNDPVQNLMRKQAAAITGLTEEQCDLAAQNSTGNGFAAVERLASGCVHVASTQDGAQNASSSYGVRPSAEMRAWILANTDAGEDYALMTTIMFELTRDFAAGGNQAISYLVGNSPATVNHLYHTQSNGIFPAAAFGSYVDIRPVGEVSMMVITTGGWSGAKPASIPTANSALLAAGADGPWGPANYNKAQSFIPRMAQMDIIDLSDENGATFADKVATSIALLKGVRDRAIAPGGRWTGDEPTAAVILKP